jgi:hypothetical protein
MANETNPKGRDLLKRLTSDPDSGITSENGITMAQVEKLVNDIDADYGRAIKSYKTDLEGQAKRIETLESDWGTLNKAKREQTAAELEKTTGVKASIILKHGGEKLEDMKAFAEELAKESNIKPAEADKSKEKAQAGATGEKTDEELKLDSNKTVGSGEPSQDQLDAMPMTKYAEHWHKQNDKKK